MKKTIILSLFCTILFSCSQKSKVHNEFKEKCIADMQNSIDYKEYGPDKAKQICDCFARKASIKYKSVEEGMKNRQDLLDLIALCKLQLSK